MYLPRNAAKTSADKSAGGFRRLMQPSCSSKLVPILLQLDETLGSGVVRFERGSMKKQLVVRRGLLAFAESSVTDEHIARVLVGMNLIPRSALSGIATAMKKGSTADQAIVTATGIGHDILKQGAREQALIIASSLLEWGDAPVRFFPGEDLVRRAFDLLLPLPQLLTEAARKAASRTHGRAHKSGVLAVSADPDSCGARKMPLNREEANALSFVTKPILVERLLVMIAPHQDGSRGGELLERLRLLGLVRLESADNRALESNIGPDSRSQLAAIDEMIQTFEVANYYMILSVAPDAKDDQIKAAYHDLARRYHPDRFQSADANVKRSAQRLFTFITAAYGTLSSPASRALYDEQRLKMESQVEASLQARAAIDPEKERMAEGLFRAGQSAMGRQDFEKAVALLKECVWLLPDMVKFRIQLGAAQSEVAAFRKDAEQNLLKAIELDGMATEAYLLLGRLYLKVNLPRRAETQFQQVLRWDPSNKEAQRELQQIQSTVR
jgi:curved DNA-binding protein CbpA